MTWYPIAHTVPQYVDANGVPYSGAVLKAYVAGTSTPTDMATDSTGGTTADSFALNALGFPVSSGNAVIIPHIDQNYKLALYPDQSSADADSGAIWTVDNISISTIGSVTNSNLATMPAYTLKGNNTNGIASPDDLTATEVAALFTTCTTQVLTSGTSATYTRPDNVIRLKIRMIGGGGGGGGCGTGGTATNGGTGGTTSFNSITAVGGTGGTLNNQNTAIVAGGAGGTGGSGSASLRIAGAKGGSTVPSPASYFGFNLGGLGASSPFGGSTYQVAAPTNSGAGGPGGYNDAGGSTTVSGGGGGGAGEYVEFTINSPSATYTYSVGTAGTAGSAGTNGHAGYAGGSGLIIVEEYYIG